MSALSEFLSGAGVDGAGRRVDEVLAFDDAALESRHDFIQWLFPLPDGSVAVPGSPMLTDADADTVRADPRALANLQAAAERMQDFYTRTHAWRATFDHNHLRITRIIRSLRLLLGNAAADDFRDEVLALLGDRPLVNPRSLTFWRQA